MINIRCIARIFVYITQNLSDLDSNVGKNILIVILGPTAVGKTNLSLALAKHYQAEIFSADSRQIYQELNIGVAKPSKQELYQVKHHFINHKSITTTYSAGNFEEDVIAALAEYFSQQNVALMTGGTGLYIKAILEGLDVFPDIDPALKQEIEDEYEKHGLGYLQDYIREHDPEFAAQAEMLNPRRLMRAIEVIRTSGGTFSSWRTKTAKHRDFTPIVIKLDRDRPELYNRINQRVDEMMRMGLLDEVKSLKPHRHLRPLETVGYTELFDHLNGLSSLEEAVELIKRNTRRYAKRQSTWNRRLEYPSFHPDDVESIQLYLDQELKRIQLR